VAKGTQSLDVHGLVRFRNSLMQALNLPIEVFGDDVRCDYVRFDFDGNGSLDVNEVYQFVKFSLWEYIKTVGDGTLKVDVPHKSLSEAGYSITRELGKGSQAKVMLCVDNDGKERCVKCYRKGAMTIGGINELKEEFEAMRFLGCRSIAQTFEVFQDSSFFYMVNEVYHGGDFATLRTRATEQQVAMTEDWWTNVFKQCLRALEHMHQQAMMHCDIKEPNLMLKTQDLRSPDVVLVDFGLTKAFHVTHDTGICGGTPGYIPPETLRTRKWFPGGDVFSLGVVVFQMLTDSTPNGTTCIGPQPRGLFLEGCSTFREVCEATFKRTPQYEKITCNFPRLDSLTEQLLRKDQQLRPRAPAVLQGPWFDPHRDSLPLASDHPLATKGITKEMLSEWMVQTASLRSEDDSPKNREKPHANGAFVKRSTDTSAVVAAALQSMQPIRVASPMRPWRCSTSPRPSVASRLGCSVCLKHVRPVGESQSQVASPHARRSPSRASSTEVAPPFVPRHISPACVVSVAADRWRSTSPAPSNGTVSRVVMSPQHTTRSSSMEVRPTRASLGESPLTMMRTDGVTRVLSRHMHTGRRFFSVEVPAGGGKPGANATVMTQVGSRTPALSPQPVTRFSGGSSSPSSRFTCTTPAPPVLTPPLVPPVRKPTVVLQLCHENSRMAPPQVSVMPCRTGGSVKLSSPGAPGLTTRLHRLNCAQVHVHHPSPLMRQRPHHRTH